MERFAALELIVLPPNLILAQTFTCSTSGIVPDPIVAVVANAPITVTELNGNLHFRASTVETSLYVVSPVGPDNYPAPVEKPGFQTLVRHAMPPSTEQKVSVEIMPSLTAVSGQLQIRGQAQMLNMGGVPMR